MEANNSTSQKDEESSIDKEAHLTESKQNDVQESEKLKLPQESEDDTAAEGGAAFDTVQEEATEDELRCLEKTLSAEELLDRKATSDKLKLQGNELFKNDQPQCSIEMYTEALNVCPTTYSKERAILYANRAAAKIKLGAKKSAIDDCTRAIELWPDYVRALLRRAKLLEHDEKLDEALADYKRVQELEVGQREACEALVRLPPIIQERNERMKEEMMSKLKDLGNMFLKPFGLSTSSFQMQQDPNTGSYSINFNQGGGTNSS